jgi:hypothetical protein
MADDDNHDNHDNHDFGELIGVDEAAEILEVARDRVQVMVEEGLLTPVTEVGEPRFRRADVIALSELGG